MEDKRYAVLIDSDNISAKYISYILDEMTKYGTISYRRIYGDWTSAQTSKWKNELLENSITPIQQFSNTVGKNATDSALIIDAMDILYTKNVEGFCIVSSDSDFTRLASRLRESGMDVIGMGEEKTPRSFRAACTVFTNLEILIEQDEEENIQTVAAESSTSAKSGAGAESGTSVKTGTKDENIISKKVLETDIAAIITENENHGKDTGLGEIGSRLVKKYSDFDVRNYGYSSLSKFLEEIERFELTKANSTVIVKMKENVNSRKQIDDYIIRVVESYGKAGIELATLGSKIHKKFDEFKVKEYGYATLAKYIQSNKSLEVKGNKAKNKVVYLVKE